MRGDDRFTPMTLGDVLDFFNGKSIKPGGIGSYAVYGSNGIIGGSEEYKYEDGIIIGRVGAYCGSVMYCPTRFWATDNTIVARAKDGPFDTRYLYYLLGESHLNRYAGGAAQPLLTQTVLRQVPVRIPTLSTQHKIAAILSAYDDLIENNLRRIAILEEMARLLYREWFVDFRFPDHEAAQVVDSPLGPIPEGWEVVPFGDTLAGHIGGGWGKDAPDEKHSLEAAVVRGTDIPRARHLSVESCPVRYHTPSNLRNRLLAAGDIVMEVSGGSTDQAVGRALLVTQELLRILDSSPICASFCKRLQVRRNLIEPVLLLLHLSAIYDDGRITEYEVQSTGIKNFKFAVFLEKDMVVVPDPTVQRRFIETAQPMLDWCQNAGARNTILRKTRDLLLPRLISGELDVEDLDIEVGELSA